MSSITGDIVNDFLGGVETNVIAAFGGDALKDVLREARLGGPGITGAKLPFDTNNRRTRQYLRENFYEKGVLNIAADTRKEISEELLSGIFQKEDYRALSKRVDKTFKEVSRARSRTIAVTETGRAANFAIVEGYKQSGIVSKIRWVTTFLNSRETHIDLNGNEVLIGENFSTQSATHGTISTEYPLQFGIPEEDINCHCRTVAAAFLDDEEMVEQEAPDVESPTVVEPPPIPEALSDLEKEGLAGNYQKVSDSVVVSVDSGANLGAVGRDVEKAVKETFDIIDGVHDISILRSLPVKITKIESNAYGTYRPSVHALNSPFSMESVIKVDAPSVVGRAGMTGHTRMTTAHETGHWLDNKLLANPKAPGTGMFNIKSSQKMGSSQADKAMAKTNKAMVKSDNYKYLEKQKAKWEKELDYLLADRRGVSPNRITRLEDSIQYSKYLLDPEEVWARAYAQYIAEKSGDRIMLKELRRDQIRNPRTIQTQWTTEDFEPIKKSIDKMFEEKGWIGGKKLDPSEELIETITRVS